jgi:hypothetical protein
MAGKISIRIWLSARTPAAISATMIIITVIGRRIANTVMFTIPPGRQSLEKSLSLLYRLVSADHQKPS